MKLKLKGPKIEHPPFYCVECGVPLNGLTENETGLAGHSGDATCFTICGYCGKVYRTQAQLVDVMMGTSIEWIPIPDDELPGELKEASQSVRLGKGPQPPKGAQDHRGMRKRN